MSLPGGRASGLQHVVFPADRPETLALYVDGPPRPDLVTGRHSCRVAAGDTVSFAAYFNAFPASYWAHWTDVDAVALQVELDGPATVTVWRSDATGAATPVRECVATAPGMLETTVELTGFDAGGWLWFEVTAGAEDTGIGSARWVGAGSPGAQVGQAGDRGVAATASLGITTYNRVESCLALLRQLGDDPDLLDVLDRVYVVDQGDDTIRAADGFVAATTGLGERLRVLEQPNLGGSGGFARCQLETLRAAESDHLVILDDDVVLETESVRRAVEFAAHCPVPTLVGAQMLSLPEPTRLHAMGESIDLRRFSWGPNREDERDRDLAIAGLRDAPFLHRREDVNYTGWWMCLIPRAVLERVGLSLPLFIRWDDAEFGLRAGASGHPTVTLPGVGVWHVPWTQKTDALDWQAYFHQRNRVVAALLHSPHPRGGALLRELFLHQVKHLASMQYSTAELRLLALSDVLAGPAQLHPSLSRKPAQARSLRAGFDDAEVRAGPEAFPAPTGHHHGAAGRGRRTPRWLSAVTGVARQLRPVPAASGRAPQACLRADDAHWSRLLAYDSAVVSTADGSGAVWLRRDRRRFVDLARRSLTMHRSLYRAWPRLAADYRGALGTIAAPATWEDTFGSVRRGA